MAAAGVHERRATILRWSCLALVGIATLGAPARASAHLKSGTLSTDFQARVGKPAAGCLGHRGARARERLAPGVACRAPRAWSSSWACSVNRSCGSHRQASRPTSRPPTAAERARDRNGRHRDLAGRPLAPHQARPRVRVARQPPAARARCAGGLAASAHRRLVEGAPGRRRPANGTLGNRMVCRGAVSVAVDCRRERCS